MKRANKKKKPVKETPKKIVYPDTILPPKPGEPETWEKIVAVENRLTLVTSEDFDNAFQTLKANYKTIEENLKNMDLTKGATLYEKEYVKPMLDQVLHDSIQLMQYDTARIKEETRKQQIRERKPTNTKEISESIEVLSSDVSNIMSGSTWAKKFFKR
ncbi:MAG: hypothetical protein LBC98_02875 [Prevotellaceae bacterium]|jgi:hypothetical protein|nr:hypothetical protein [Prevotellaceae bacterium]